MMTVEEMMKDANLEPETINQVIKEFQKALACTISRVLGSVHDLS